MSRVSKTQLASSFKTLAALLGWDAEGPAYAPREDGAGSRAVIGHTFLVHNSVYGWHIARMVNEGGGESRIKESCTASEMETWLSGAIFAARNASDVLAALVELEQLVTAHVGEEADNWCRAARAVIARAKGAKS